MTWLGVDDFNTGRRSASNQGPALGTMASVLEKGSSTGRSTGPRLGPALGVGCARARRGAQDDVLGDELRRARVHPLGEPPGAALHTTPAGAEPPSTPPPPELGTAPGISTPDRRQGDPSARGAGTGADWRWETNWGLHWELHSEQRSLALPNSEFGECNKR
jgi:hypothetical protein